MIKGPKLCFQDVLCCFKPPHILFFRFFSPFFSFGLAICQLIPALRKQGRGGLVPTLLQFVPVSSQHPRTLSSLSTKCPLSHQTNSPRDHSQQKPPSATSGVSSSAPPDPHCPGTLPGVTTARGLSPVPRISTQSPAPAHPPLRGHPGG